ncbi:MAG: histidine phosphatase family protein [Dehalococcoidales bacterium]|nr:histidine phosphatase family protein [Dehalococcoidales bacterium]
MQDLYVVTHAQATHHIDGLLGGWYDTSLTEKGTSQATALGNYLFEQIQVPGIPVYSSDLKRALQTAEQITRIFNSTITTDARLRELNFGEGNEKPDDWLQAHMTPPPVDGNRLDHRMYKGSESRREAGQRISVCIDEIVSTKEENIIIVTHGHTLSFVIMAWLKIPVEHMAYGQFRTWSATVTHLHEDDLYGNRGVEYISKQIG